MLWDYKVEGCILKRFTRLQHRIEEAMEAGYMPHGLLMAPPCTDFSNAGAWTWKSKDERPAGDEYEGFTQTELSIALASIGVELANLYPFQWWALENPPGRIESLIPELKEHRRLMFQPHHYGDPYTKKTVLWGNFNADLPRNDVDPELVTIKAGDHYYQASSMWAKTGGKSERTKTLRSNTPAGFANAFFAANQ